MGGGGGGGRGGRWNISGSKQRKDKSFQIRILVDLRNLLIYKDIKYVKILLSTSIYIYHLALSKDTCNRDNAT